MSYRKEKKSLENFTNASRAFREFNVTDVRKKNTAKKQYISLILVLMPEFNMDENEKRYF